MNAIERRLTIINWLAFVGACGLLFGSIWPGVIDGWFFCLVLPVVGFMAIWWLTLAVRWFISKEDRRRSLGRIGAAPFVAVSFLMLLNWDVPLRIVFSFCRPEFDRLRESTPFAGTDGKAIDKHVSIYHVDYYADSGGDGIFFRTRSEGPQDITSWGFVYRPNPNAKITPFGYTNYDLQHLTGDWYCFEVTDRF